MPWLSRLRKQETLRFPFIPAGNTLAARGKAISRHYRLYLCTVRIAISRGALRIHLDRDALAVHESPCSRHARYGRRKSESRGASTGRRSSVILRKFEVKEGWLP